MRIDSQPRSVAIGRAATSRSGGSGVFAPAGGAAPARASGATPVQAMASLDSILALQSVDDATQGRRRAVRRGRDLLDLLDGIKADLLLGQVSLERLDQMAVQVGQMRERSLAGLDAVLDDIDLRVRVELAKWGRFPA